MTNISNRNMDKYYYVTLSLFMIIYEAIIIFIILFSACIILCTIQLLWVDLLEYYWNNVSEQKFIDKLHNVVIEVNPRIMIFDSRCLLINIQYIYEGMNKYEQQRFDRLVYNYGLAERLSTFYRKNI
uniref:Uncharacterized protein n=1 Tax=viral metagenome TaxID=1070528 RepID=A0A6C0D7P7_9ZZZZ